MSFNNLYPTLIALTYERKHLFSKHTLSYQSQDECLTRFRKDLWWEASGSNELGSAAALGVTVLFVHSMLSARCFSLNVG
jgi:hypothetical protein